MCVKSRPPLASGCPRQGTPRYPRCMCGRFVATATPDQLAGRFRVDHVDAGTYRPSWNVAPTQETLAVATSRDGSRRLAPFRWGLVPVWAKSIGSTPLMINLRAETVAAKPGFARLLARRRCVVPTDGFYEWQDRGRGRPKQPFLIRSRDESTLALAGLWDAWRDQELPEDHPEAWRYSCTILTTTPNRRIAPVHDRMPVVLHGHRWDTWLDPATSPDDAAMLMEPAPEDLLDLRPVSTAVNRVGNDGPELVEPVVVPPHA